MPVIRKKLAPSDVYPDDIRYDSLTDEVQSFVNGEWVDNPLVDPRLMTTLPPRITADSSCDAGESVKEALKAKIDDILVAIDNAATLFTIAGIILSVFTLGTYAIFVSVALGIGDQMLTAGTAALTAALTEGVYDQLVCILNCNMDAQGRVNEGDLGQIQAQVNDEIGGLGATIINAMLALAGEGGINNLASLGTATGDCDECECSCGFTTSEAVGNWDLWTLLEENLVPADFPNGLTLNFFPVDTHPAPSGTTGAYWTPHNYSGAIGMMHEFAEPCFVTSLAVSTLGSETQVARMAAGYRVGSTWTLIDNVVRATWGSGETFAVNEEVDAIGFQYVNGGGQVVAIVID